MIEADFIAALRALPLHPGARGLADDVAVIGIGGETLVLTHDAIAEGVHYLPGTDPADVAWKLVATNLSDLAAKGAEPIGVLVGATLTPDAARFAAGLGEALAAYGTVLLGGDTLAVPPDGKPVYGLTAIGRATHVPVPHRGGARAGDTLWLAGTLGDAMLGHAALSRGEQPAERLRRAYLRPHALLAEGKALAPQVTAMMDVSDGLLLDASRMAQASNVTLAIDSAALPFSPEFLATAPKARDAALRWGDDYALLFTLPAGQAPPIPGCVRIGRCLSARETPLLLDGTPPSGKLGYSHQG